jgi:hypothetical protein
MAQPQKLSGAGGSWDDPTPPQIPIPIGLTPGHEPSETAIPRALDALSDRVPSIPSVIKNALSPAGLGEGSEVDPANDTGEHTFSGMWDELKTAGSQAKKTLTSSAGLKGMAKQAGSDAVSTMTALQPSKYAKQIKQGDYAGAIAGAGVDTAETALALAAHEPGARLAGEHPAVGQAALDSHLTTGGSTFDPRTGKNLAGSNNWAVGVAPEHTVVSTHPFTPEQYNDFVGLHRDLLQRNPNLHVGTWADPTGLHYMDVTATTPNKAAAVQMGKELNQKSIFHLGRGEELPTGGTGEPVSSPFSVDYRAQAMTAATPEKKPFAGYHLSNDKLDYIDGNRRGAPQAGTGQAVGQESPRLNVKSQFGVGQDAPPGFYAYSNGTRPEPAVVSRKFSHEIRGNFALADVTDPKWNDAAHAAYEDAFDKTGNDTVATYASVNAKEHAIRDAGYDGYTSPGTGINFFFDGQPTRLTGAPVKPSELSAGQLSSEAGLARAAVQRKGLGGGPAAAAPAADAANPWGNLEHDQAAQTQARTELGPNADPQAFLQRAQQIKQELMQGGQGGHAGNGVSSVEEINRPGNNFLLDKNGKLTFHGKSFAPEETPAGGAHVTVLPTGEYRLNAGALNGPMQTSLSNAAKELGIQHMRPAGESPSVQPTGASFTGEQANKVHNGDPLSLLNDNERNQAMTKRLGNQFTSILRKLPEVQDFEAAARKGAVGRTWYQRSIDAFDAMRKLAPDYFQPQDADKWANVVAATSPQQGVPLNLREALGFWKDWHDAGRPTTISDIQKAMKNGDIRPLTNQPSKLPNVVRAINDQDMLPGDKKKYYKVGNFGQNLTKSFGNVTLDSWMGAFANVADQDVAKPQFYHAMALRTREAAQKLGWHPAEAQAAIWTFTKTLAEMSGWKAAGGKYYRPTEMLDRLTPDKMREYTNDFADIMKTDPEVRGKLSELGVDLNELDKRLKNVTPKPAGEAFEGADKEALARGLKRNAARIGKSQRGLEGFSEYSRPPAQSELDLGSPDDGDASFSFGGPLADAIKASRIK